MYLVMVVLYFKLYISFRAELELEKEAREEAEAHAALLTEQRELEGKRWRGIISSDVHSHPQDVQKDHSFILASFLSFSSFLMPFACLG